MQVDIYLFAVILLSDVKYPNTMRFVKNLFCIFFIAVLFISCGGNTGQWAKHNVPEGGYSISMPADAKKTEKKEFTAFGKQTTHFLTWKPSSFAIDKFKLFQVSYTNCPANVMADSNLMNLMLDSAIDIRKRDFSESEIIQSENIELNGYPGRAFFYDAPKGNTIVTVKICIANNRLYDLVVISKKNYSTNTEMGNFFNSFAVTN